MQWVGDHLNTLAPVPGSPQPILEGAALDEEPVVLHKTLRPGKRCRFTFDGLSLDPGHTVVAWFTDDAGFRWQVDEDMDLVQADDETRHLP